MIGNTKQILKSLFDADSLDEISISRLQEVVEQFPFFHMGHYLLTRKLQKEGSEAFLNQVQKTAIHFNNPLWLQLLLERKPDGKDLSDQGTGQDAPVVDRIMETIAMKTELREISVNQEQGLEEDGRGEIWRMESTKTVQITESFPDLEVPIPETNITYIESKLEESMLWHREPTADTEPAASAEQESDQSATAFPVQTEMEISPENQDSIPADFIPRESEEAGPADQDTDSYQGGLSSDERETIDFLLFQQKTESAKLSGLAPDEPGQHPPAGQIMGMQESGAAAISKEFTEPAEIPIPVQGFQDAAHGPEFSTQDAFRSPEQPELHEPAFNDESSGPGAAELASPPTQDREPAEPVNDDLQTLKEDPSAGMVSEKETGIAADHFPPDENAPAMEESGKDAMGTPGFETTSREPSGELSGQSGQQLSAEQEGPLFEPYYTIDYFASQGIRLSLDEVPTDRFGKQLKSFTDWLKIMKRLPLTTILEQADELDDINIQSIAAHSNEERDIVTETMAEVLARQGKYEKAIDLYHKLSLLNPSKSTYFAARIEQLKTNLA